ncbi:uncharacterized protein B0P05DRAFT_482105 [Gilbertella persicaria]|uniref:uncharacterized protein n=1 Tax=Gilbertella persicaria TaxID=101096 RepID=UPI002220B334|nr:uncharacterized protein B0P05DRAFT_482105 [Gilbertella persicaria]KAI8047040.1 hypothetical protein B0P05DRAFT_482105 [Gilbertella persicaria]
MNDSIDIHIRWPNDQELLFSISYNKDTIQSIKQKIRYYAPEQTTKKTMRLIHRGQLLVHDQYTLSDYGIRHQPQLFIHCALSDPLIPTSTLHQTKETKSRLAGFDKLRESGYNDEEIRSIRLQFHQSHPDYIDGEPVSQELLALEETWIEHTGRLLPPEGCK